MSLDQLSNNPAFNSFEESFNRLLAKVQSVPLLFWRRLIVVIALIWVCRSLATLFWVAFPVPTTPAPGTIAEPLATGNTAPPPQKKIDLSSLQSKNIFGDSTGVVIEQEKVDVDINGPKTKLKLELAGVLVSSDPDKSTAIIANGSEQKVYQIGEVVPGGNNVKLAKVLPDKVILDNRGKFESLWLFTEDDFKKPTQRTSSRSSSRSSSRASGAIKKKISKDRVPKSINEVIRFSVYREEGKMMGYRIRPGRDRELFGSLGLKANDIVTSVNGVTVDDPQQIRQNYQALKTATEANLEILRDGEVLSINISLDTGE